MDLAGCPDAWNRPDTFVARSWRAAAGNEVPPETVAEAGVPSPGAVPGAC
nr:hypothetical protein RVX_0507 [Nitratidesulfovibrio sp. HK-II]